MLSEIERKNANLSGKNELFSIDYKNQHTNICFFFL